MTRSDRAAGQAAAAATASKWLASTFVGIVLCTTPLALGESRGAEVGRTDEEPSFVDLLELGPDDLIAGRLTSAGCFGWSVLKFEFRRDSNDLGPMPDWLLRLESHSSGLPTIDLETRNIRLTEAQVADLACEFEIGRDRSPIRSTTKWTYRVEWWRGEERIFEETFVNESGGFSIDSGTGLVRMSSRQLTLFGAWARALPEEPSRK